MGAVLTVRRAPRRRVALPATLGALESMAALALAHAAAGGEVPPAAWLAVFGLLAFAGSVVVLQHRAGIRVVLPLLLAGQLLGHAWLVTLTPASGAGGHVHDPAGGAVVGLTPSMLAAHTVAALVVGAMWVLRRRAVAVLLRWSDLGVVPTPAPRRTTPGAVVSVRATRAWLTTAPVRGPPVGAATA